MKNTIFFFLWAAFAIVGCSGSISTPTKPSSHSEPTSPDTLLASSTYTPERSLTATPSPTSSLTPTEFIPTSTPTNTSTPTPIIPPESKLSLNCLAVLPSLPDNADVAGTVLLVSRSETITGTLLVNMVTGETIHLTEPNERAFKFVTSPDRRTMAYVNLIYDERHNLIGEELVIADAEGIPLKVVPWEERWQTIRGITNDRFIFISYNVSEIDGEIRYPLALLVFDPFSGQAKIINPNFPAFISHTRLPFWDEWMGVVYDPTVSYAIYPKDITDQAGEKFTFALWDVKKNRLVNTFESIYSNIKLLSVAAPMPVWSPDGSQFGLVGLFLKGQEVQFELFKVGKDGQTEQLTHLTDIAAPVGLVFSWSPDNSKIAMNLSSASYMKAEHAAILDLKSGQVTDYCVEKHGNPEKEPIWSPDGTQIIVYDQYTEKHSRAILIDIVQNFAAVIAEDMEPVGWLRNP